MGGAGDPPAPVGDPPTGTAASYVAKRPCPLARNVAPVPSGKSPDGTGGSPVLPANHFPNTLLAETAAPPQRVPLSRLVPRRASARVPRKVRRSASFSKIGSRRSPRFITC